MRTGTVAVCALTVVVLFGATALEQLERRPAARAREDARARRRGVMRTFMSFSVGRRM
jgi:hypothetical protein